MTLRVGLSGCGAMGLRAVQQMRTHGHCAVAALHDPDPARLAAFAPRDGVSVATTSFDELLASGVDFVVLAGPPGVRLDQVARAAEQCVPCLLHSPMAVDVDEAAAMLAAMDAAGGKLGVAVAGQEDPFFEEVRRMIAADWFGGLVLVQGIAGDDDLLRRPRAPDDWRLHPELAGTDPMLRVATHHVHLAAWLTGRPALQVTAQTARGFLPLPGDTTVATALLRGNVQCTFAASHLTVARSFALHGTDGGLRIDGDRIWMHGHKQYFGAAFDYPEPRREASFTRQDLAERTATARRELELHGRFARWLEDTDDFPCPGEQAVLDLRVLAAIARAAATGVRVDV